MKSSAMICICVSHGGGKWFYNYWKATILLVSVIILKKYVFTWPLIQSRVFFTDSDQL